MSGFDSTVQIIERNKGMERIEGDLSRRGFVGAAFAGAMGIAASSVFSGCSAGGSSAADGDWTETFDVVVVGSEIGRAHV